MSATAYFSAGAKRMRMASQSKGITVRNPLYIPGQWNLMAKKRRNIRRSYRGLNRRGVASRETGFVDNALAAFECSTTGTIALVNTVPQGASVNQRVGKKIILKSMQFRGQWIAGQTTVTADAAVILVYDKRPTGALPAITDILVTVNSQSFNNDANSGRFQIIKRWDSNFVGPSVAPTNETAVQSADYFVKLRNLPVVYKAAGTGAIGDIEQGALYLVSVGDKATGTLAPIWSTAQRLRFLDI